MKKLLFAINNFNVGGAERLVLNQVKNIHKNEFEAWILTLLDDPKINFASEAEFLGNRLVRIKMSGLFNFIAFYKIFLFIKREKFDAVITGLFLPNVFVRFAAILAGTKVIISHEHSIYLDKRRWQIIVDRFLSYFTDKIITSSLEVLDFTSRQEKIPVSKFAINPNSISLDQSVIKSDEVSRAKKKFNIPEESAVFTTAGRLIEQKGQSYLLRAAAQVRNIRPGLKWKLLIFGEGSLRQDLEKLIDELFLRDIAYLAGVAPMRDILAVTDIFVLPSLWEGLSLALLEAMNAGKPVIATRVSGSLDAVIEGRNGFLVSPKDVNSLADKMVILLENDELCERMGKESVVIVKKFSIDNNIILLENMINSILKEKTKKHD